MSTSGSRVTFASLTSNLKAVQYHWPQLPYGAISPKDLLAQHQGDAEAEGEWESFASDVSPLLHHALPALLTDFLDVKSAFGTPLEKALYQGMTPADLVTRMLRCRPLTFFMPSDQWRLRDGREGYMGFDDVGVTQNVQLPLEEVMTYDEIALAALVSVAVPTRFLNDGSRFNQGVQGQPGSHEHAGVYTGCVGPRFERPGLMEWAHMVITPAQNTEANGYGERAPNCAAADTAALPGETRRALLQAWARFYGQAYFPTHEEAAAAAKEQPGRYVSLGGLDLLDATLYKQRIRRVVEPFMLDADRRAAAAGRRAYVHLVGLGLGAWGLHDAQGALMVDAYADILNTLNLPHVDTIDFSYFPDNVYQCGGASSGSVFVSAVPETRPTIMFSQRNPAEPLPPSPVPLLLVGTNAHGAPNSSHAVPGSGCATGTGCAHCVRRGGKVGACPTWWQGGRSLLDAVLSRRGAGPHARLVLWQPCTHGTATPTRVR